MRLDRATAERLLGADPDHLHEGAAMLVDVAAKQDRVELAELLLALGVSPDAEYPGPAGRYRALHQAACLDHVAVARFLLERGADPDARDEAFQATPLGWALHTQMPGAIELFARHTRDVFTLVAGGQTARLAALLAEAPGRANETLDAHIGLGLLGADAGETPLFALPDGEDSALEVAELLLAAGADPTRRNRAGQTPADKARARGLAEVAERLAVAG
jgi:ankyrin repeat protein